MKKVELFPSAGRFWTNTCKRVMKDKGVNKVGFRFAKTTNPHCDVMRDKSAECENGGLCGSDVKSAFHSIHIAKQIYHVGSVVLNNFKLPILHCIHLLDSIYLGISSTTMSCPNKDIYMKTHIHLCQMGVSNSSNLFGGIVGRYYFTTPECPTKFICNKLVRSYCEGANKASRHA